MRLILASLFLALLLLSGCQQAISSQTGSELEDVGAILVYDNFDNSILGSTWTGSSSGQYSINSGEFEMTCTSTQYVASASATKSQAFADVSVEVKAKWISGSKGDGYGIMFRDEGTDNGQYRFCVCENGSYAVFLGVTPLVDWTTSALIKASDWNTLKIICIDTSIKCLINGTQVVNISNSALTSGNAYLFAGGQQTVHFDNYKCWYWMRTNNEL